MINDLAEKLMAATQRPGRPHSVEEFKGILRVALGAPTADEGVPFEFEPTEAYKALLAEAEAAERRHAYKDARDSWLETGLLHEREPLYRKAPLKLTSSQLMAEIDAENDLKLKAMADRMKAAVLWPPEPKKFDRFVADGFSDGYENS